MGDNLDTLEIALHFNKTQEMITFIFEYLIIGMVLTMFIDYWTHKLEIHEAKFTNSERISSMLLWPILLLMIIIEIILNK
jgi:hypothetical protein